MDRNLHLHLFNYLSSVSTAVQTASTTTVWSAEVSSVVIQTWTSMYTTGPTKATTPQPVTGRPGVVGYACMI
jgi:hypothetical protein